MLHFMFVPLCASCIQLSIVPPSWLALVSPQLDGDFPRPSASGARGSDPSSAATDSTLSSAASPQRRRAWRGWVRTHAELQRALCLSPSIAAVPLVAPQSSALSDVALCEALFELTIAPWMAALPCTSASTGACSGLDSSASPLASSSFGFATRSLVSAFVLGAMLPLVVVPMTRVSGLRGAALAAAVVARFPPPAIEALACAVCESVRVVGFGRAHSYQSNDG